MAVTPTLAASISKSQSQSSSQPADADDSDAHRRPSLGFIAGIVIATLAAICRGAYVISFASFANALRDQATNSSGNNFPLRSHRTILCVKCPRYGRWRCQSASFEPRDQQQRSVHDTLHGERAPQQFRQFPGPRFFRLSCFAALVRSDRLIQINLY
jgi:hypothetical protein